MTDGADILVILLMAAGTYSCRTVGYVAMGFVPLTPRVRRALEALPGSIVVSLALPGALAAGVVGAAGALAAVGVMYATRRDLLAIVAGCGTAAALRAFGW